MPKTKNEKKTFMFRALRWNNVCDCSAVEGTTYKDHPLRACIVADGSVDPVILSQPFQDVDGKVKYLRYNRETGKWDKRHPKIAQKFCGLQDTHVTLSCC